VRRCHHPPPSRSGRGFRKGRAECLYIFYIFYRFYRNCQVGTGKPVLQEGLDDFEDERLEEWGEWMRETLLLDILHRRVVFTIPKTLGIFPRKQLSISYILIARKQFLVLFDEALGRDGIGRPELGGEQRHLELLDHPPEFLDRLLPIRRCFGGNGLLYL